MGNFFNVLFKNQKFYILMQPFLANELHQGQLIRLSGTHQKHCLLLSSLTEVVIYWFRRTSSSEDWLGGTWSCFKVCVHICNHFSIVPIQIILIQNILQFCFYRSYVDLCVSQKKQTANCKSNPAVILFSLIHTCVRLARSRGQIEIGPPSEIVGPGTDKIGGTPPP